MKFLHYLAILNQDSDFVGVDCSDDMLSIIFCRLLSTAASRFSNEVVLISFDLNN